MTAPPTTELLTAEAPATGQDMPAADDADRRVLLALCTASFLASLTFAAPAPFYPEMADDLGVTVPLLGQFSTVMLLLSALFGLAVGPIADRYGHRRVLLVGMVAVALTLLGIGLAPTYPALLGVGAAGGLGDAVVLGLPLAIAGTRFSGEAHRRAVGWTIASLASAPIVGVPLLTLLGSFVGWRPVFAVIGAVALGATWLVRDALPADAPRPTGTGRLDARALLAAYRPLLGHRPTLRLFGATALRAMCWLGLLNYLGAFLDEELDLSTRLIGVSYMLGGGGYFLGSLAAGGRLGRYPLRPLFAVTTAAMGVLMGVIFATVFGTVAAIGLLPLAGVAGAIGWVALTTLLASETPAGAGTTMVLNGSIFNLGAAGGGAIGGLLLALGGYGVLALGLPVFAIAAALLVWWPSRRGARRAS